MGEGWGLQLELHSPDKNKKLLQSGDYFTGSPATGRM